jgi:3-hydroxybutyryl-CoA dehydrogenase
MDRQAVGVVGAGTIGAGVAQALAESAHQVVLVDVSAERLAAAERAIRRSTRLRVLLDRRNAAGDADRVVGRIRFGTEHRRLGEVGFVIENVTEKWEVKRDLYASLDRVCAPEALFAVNTSAIPITRVASLTRRPARVVGMHFMNPVPLMPMVEIIRGFHTAEATIAAARALVADMGKESIVVGDSPGFVTNRVMMLMVNEAIFLLQERVASAEEVDRLFKTCFGHKMGPLETADLIGLDTVLYSLDVLHASFHDSKYRPCPLLATMVDAGLHGRKTGRGFYRYAEPGAGEGPAREEGR